MREFWNLCTRQAERNGFGLTVAQAEIALVKLESNFEVLEDGLATYNEWKRLINHYGVSGAKVHDAYLVAAMNVHSIPYILTFNTSDFTRYPMIVAVDPIALVAAEPPSI